ncbi:MAG: transglycosylase [Deltaproteobacteria bacterium]|nr:transglycosylase [Deltaproteobacteria bacterium]
MKIAGIVFFVLVCGFSHGSAYDKGIENIRGEIEFMKKDDPDKYRDFRYALRHIRSINKKQRETTSIFVAKAVADHVHGKKYRFTSNEHRLNFLSVIMGIIRVESCFNPHAVSGKNARGLMQVHWPTWKQYFSSQEEAHDLNRNLSVGTQILGLYMNRSNNDLRLALYKYLGAKDDRYADKVIASAIAFKKSVLSNPIKDILDGAENGR